MHNLVSKMFGESGPARRLLVAAMVETVGFGCFITINVIYFTTTVELSAAEVGGAITLAGLISLSGGIPSGVLADRWGPRRILVASLVIQACATAMLVTVSSVWAYAILLTVVGFGERAAYASRGALMAQVFSSERVTARARMRSISNVGIALGSAVGAIALHLNSEMSFQVLILLNAATWLASAALARKLPLAVNGSRELDRKTVVVLRDRRYLSVIALNALICIHYGMFEVGMPLWIAMHTEAPRWLVGLLILLNTALVVTLQVRVSRGSDDVRGSAHALRWAGLLLVLASAGFALAGTASMWMAVAVLVVSGVIYTFAEMLQAAGSWGLSYALAPEDRHGEYQGAFGTGATLGMKLGPVIIASFVVASGGTGWYVVGALLGGACLVMTPLSRWAATTDGKASSDDSSEVLESQT